MKSNRPDERRLLPARGPRGLSLWIPVLALALAGCALAPSPAAYRTRDPASAWNSDVDLGARLWHASTRGDVKAGGGGMPGTDLDFDHELGLHKHEVLTSYYLRAQVDTDWDVLIDYLRYSESGNSVLNQDAYFRGALLQNGSSLSSKLSFDSFLALAGYKLYDFRGFSYGLRGGLLGVLGDASLYAVPQDPLVFPTSIKDDWSLYTPVVGFFTSYLSRAQIEISAEGQGTWLKYRDSAAHYLDGTFKVGYYFMDNFQVYAGYQYRTLFMKDDEVDFQTRFKGPTLGFWFRF